MAAGAGKLAAFLAGTALAALGAEAAARIAYREPWHARLAVLPSREDWRASIRLNRYGLRGREPAAEKPPGARRVLLLGDSFTFGSGVADDAAIFPAVLERELDESRGGGGRVEVLNGGLHGSLTGEWVALLRSVRDRFRPDLVVVVFFLRDGTRTSSAGAFFEPIRDGIVARNAASAAYRASALVRLWRDRLDRREISERYSAAIREAYFGAPDRTEEWRIARENLLAIRDLAREGGARTALVVFPILAGLDEEAYPFQDVSDAIAACGASIGLPVHDLLPAFRGRSAPGLWVSAENQHPNAEGHRLAAESLRPFVEGLLAE